MNGLRLVALYGTGDTYLVCALARQVAHRHGRPVTIVVKRSHAAIPAMFGLNFCVDDVLVRRAEGDGALHREHVNDIRRNLHYYVHPHFLRSGVRVDQLTVKPEVSQADMYRALLHLPPDAPLDVPSLPFLTPQPDTVLLIPEARSWPNWQPAFWTALAERLQAAGRCVAWNDAGWSLSQLFEICTKTEWVIGPQCGVMAILCAARFPCRKTFATPSIDGGHYPGLPVADTFPYGYVTKFAGEDYDVEEFKITGDNHGRVVNWIAGGANMRRLRPVRTEPVRSVMAPLSPGDAIDRAAVLWAKNEKFGPERSAAIAREMDRYLELVRGLHLPEPAALLYAELAQVHLSGFDMHERFVRGALAGEPGLEADHAAAVKLNKRRVELRQQLDEMLGAATTEVKSYYSAVAEAKAAE